MTAFTVTVDDAEVRKALQRLSAAAADPRPALEAVGDKLYEITRNTFGASTDPWGRAWRPTKAGNRPLIGAGRFLSGPSLFHRVEGNAVTVGSSAIYAAIHQFGGQAGRGKKVTIPARPFLPITQSGELAPVAQRAVVEIVEEYLSSVRR